MSNLPQRRRVLMFTESEKNEIIAHVVEKWVYGHDVCLPECDYCDRVFPKVREATACPCHMYTKKYVKDTFWKAMK